MDIRAAIIEAIREQLRQRGIDVAEAISLEQPANLEHGDWSTNVVLAHAKQLGRAPRELASELASDLNEATLDHVDRVDVAGPGFVNFHLRPTWLHEVLVDTVAAGTDGFGRATMPQPVNVMVEFVSANPTGPLHAGHARGATYGDSVARLLSWVGYDVWREFYINDRGSQMIKMGESILARQRGTEIPEGGYGGEYIAEWANSFVPSSPQLSDAELVSEAVEHGYEMALVDQQQTLALLDIAFDEWFSERDLVESGAIEATLDALRERGLTEQRDGATWLLSTKFGDDKDRVLIKSDGSYTYFLPDIAYHHNKFSRGFDQLINVWGSDHHGYVARMTAAMVGLGYRAEQLDVRITQMVKLMRGGAEVKISKRTGDIIELRDIVDEVGAGATRLTYLSQSVDSPQTVDLGVIVAQSMENPVFYIQMAHARLCSIQRTAAQRDVAAGELATTDLGCLHHERELEVLRCLHSWPAVVKLAADQRAPHKVTTWLRELAAAVHGFHHDCPVVRTDVEPQLAAARLWLAEAARIGLATGLGVLGVEAPEAM